MEQGKKRILFVANSGPMHINKFHLPYIDKLIELGHIVEIACSQSDEVPVNCEKHEIPFGLGISFVRFLKSFLLMSKLSKNSRYDVIYTHTAVPSAIVRVVFDKKIFRNTKIVYMAHGFHFSNESSILSWFLYYPVEKILSKNTDDLIVINSEDYRLAIKKFSARTVHLVKGIGIDNVFLKNKLRETDKVSLKQGLHGEKSYKLFYAGDLNKNKNQTLLIKTMVLLKKRHSNVGLLLAGDGKNKKKLQKEIVKNRLNGSVEILGYIPKEEVKNYLEQSDLVVASSLREGLPINVLESFALGIPVVATDVRGHNDLVKHGINGYLTRVDANDFSNYICKIIENPKLYERLSQEAINTSQEYFLENVMSDILRIILE